ncbi:hypothetical protein JCM10213_002069 [Rhodosporidiobolus nylandii]
MGAKTDALTAQAAGDWQEIRRAYCEFAKSCSSKLYTLAGQERLLRLLNIEFGTFLHPKLKKRLQTLTKPITLAYLALHFRLPRPLRCGTVKEYASAFYRFCAAFDRDDVLRSWLRDVFCLPVFSGLRKPLLKGKNNPALRTRILYDETLLQGRYEVKLARHRYYEAGGAAEEDDVLLLLRENLNTAEDPDVIIVEPGLAEKAVAEKAAPAVQGQPRRPEQSGVPGALSSSRRSVELEVGVVERTQKKEGVAGRRKAKTPQPEKRPAPYSFSVSQPTRAGQMRLFNHVASQNTPRLDPALLARSLSTLTTLRKDMDHVGNVSPAQRAAFASWLSASAELSAALHP